MATGSRELSIVYSSSSAITIGGSSTDFLLHGEPVVIEGPDSGSLSFQCIVIGTSESDFATNLQTFEDAFREPRKRLRVILGSETPHDWNPASGVNTGWNHDPQFHKPGSPEFDSARSRLYNVTITFDLPADKYSQAGRRDSTVEVVYTPARRITLTITGEYRSLTSTDSARTQFENNISTYESTVKTAVNSSATFELVEQEDSTNDTDTICTFRRVHEAILLEQAVGVTNNSDIVRQTLTARARRNYDGDSPGRNAKRFAVLEVDYSCWVDSTSTTDLIGLWEGTIRQHVKKQALAAFNAGSGAIMNEAPAFDGVENRITATMEIWATAGSSVIEYKVTTDDTTNFGEVLIPIWTADPFQKYRYQGPAQRIRKVTEVSRVMGKASGGGGGGGLLSFGSHGAGILEGNVKGITIRQSPGGKVINPFAGAIRSGNVTGIRLVGQGGGGGGGNGDLSDPPWVHMSTTTTSTPLVLGSEADGGAIPVTDITTINTYEFYNPFRVAKKRKSKTTGRGTGATTTAKAR